MSHVYCPECGFQRPEAAKYCARCGALIVRETVGETTMSLGPDEIEAAPEITGPALVVRSGGGRAGESFRGDTRTVMSRRAKFSKAAALRAELAGPANSRDDRCVAAEVSSGAT